MSKNRLPKGSQNVIKTLENEGALTQRELISTISEENPRAIRYTIRTLLEKGILISHPNFEDMRSSLISINNQMKDIKSNLLKITKSN
ncbi:MAG: hypothetical protein HGN29_08380 [Asgard group archaeon]|nr:hypothetical protein [Asgard group archaeon]